MSDLEQRLRLDDTDGRRAISSGFQLSRGAVLALALLAGFLLLASVRLVAHNLSAGIDEVAHIGAAAWLDATGSNELNLEHPPLTKRMAGAAMHYGGVAPELDVNGEPPDQWDLGRALLVQDGVVHRGRLDAARLPFSFLALLGAAAVFGWALSLFGRNAALFALFLYALSPTIHAHGALVLTDLALGSFAVTAMALIWVARGRRSMPLAIAGGMAMAAAVFSKYTGLMLVPLVLLLLLLEPVTIPSQRRVESLLANLRIAAAAALGFVLAFAAIAAVNGGLGEYLQGVTMLGHNHRAVWQYFAMGEFSQTGFLSYFPLTIGLKSTPVELGAWALALVAVASAGRGLRASAASPVALVNMAWVLAFPLAYLAALMLQAPNIGHRYTVPVYPFLFVGAAAAMHLKLAPSWRAATGVLLVLAQGMVAWRSLPDPLAYFNGFAGCNGARAALCLDDSNVDWGQNMHRVWPAIEARLGSEERPVVLLFSALPIDAYLPRFEPLLASDWETPRAVLYVLSGHNVIRWWAAAPRLAETALFRALDGAESIGNNYFLLDLRAAPDGPGQRLEPTAPDPT
ncbi:MAG: phospholipid carrier-dependent glycosyltransferase [Delftia acidovorans]|nr:phospholipid carrier-dependent glycosyltransferase [Delftia acidovorans]MBP6692506.1 phospholipid carrier-dependent glycosyltransferase [Xanthomonadales bacterium]HQW64040.1 phospholipid carrier-dependent glycosyltransferase [Pseudomonadota bacterium]MBP7417738.1 phospholipid carrier-dependent glycosyltransferase [Xanthomonadales bacterium]HQX25087.1 phospholipid carrier-dependent glycosyltransferase [Pseudomonadota bacterium]